MGHTFGAPHDGGHSTVSPATTIPYLMAPQLNGSDQFSPCSIQQIQPVIAAASCLTAYSPPDASIVVPTPTLQGTVGTALIASFTVQALGDDASSNAPVTVSMPATLTIQSVSANGGSCTPGAGIASF